MSAEACGAAALDLRDIEGAKTFGAGELAYCPKGYFENPSPPDTSAEAWRCLYSAASARLLLRFSFILRRPTTMAFKTAGLTPLVMSARTSVR